MSKLQGRQSRLDRMPFGPQIINLPYSADSNTCKCPISRADGVGLDRLKPVAQSATGDR